MRKKNYGTIQLAAYDLRRIALTTVNMTSLVIRCDSLCGHEDNCVNYHN